MKTTTKTLTRKWQEEHQDVTIDDQGLLHGRRKFADGVFCRFSACVPLAKISLAWYQGDEKTSLMIWALSDGYGEPGFVPCQGYDWSGIRDSSDEATEKMVAVAENWWHRLGGGPWPWEEKNPLTDSDLVLKDEGDFISVFPNTGRAQAMMIELARLTRKRYDLPRKAVKIVKQAARLRKLSVYSF